MTKSKIRIYEMVSGSSEMRMNEDIERLAGEGWEVVEHTSINTTSVGYGFIITVLFKKEEERQVDHLAEMDCFPEG